MLQCEDPIDCHICRIRQSIGSPTAVPRYIAVKSKYKSKSVMEMMVVRDKRVWEQNQKKNSLNRMSTDHMIFLFIFDHVIKANIDLCDFTSQENILR
jgi:hypothetical protein